MSEGKVREEARKYISCAEIVQGAPQRCSILHLCGAGKKKINMEPFREARWVLPRSAGMLRDRRGVLEIWVPCVRKNILCSNEPTG